MSIAVRDHTAAARAAARMLAALPGDARDAALEQIAAGIERAAGEIAAANAADVDAASGQRPAIIDRLTLTAERIAELAAGVRAVAALPDPIGQVLDERTRPDGLHITKLRVPLGVVCVVYEARPNVTTDAAALCLKSGTASCADRGSRPAPTGR
jgi:glutamate-5-semialdehyde dehydrogenase